MLQHTARARETRQPAPGADRVADALFGAWRRIRGPFCLPRGLHGHKCDRHWEVIDGGLAGCRLCGAMHLCFRRSCPTICSNEGLVCSVTSVCLGKFFVPEMSSSSGMQLEAAAREQDDLLRYRHAQRRPHSTRPTASLPGVMAGAADAHRRPRRDLARDRRAGAPCADTVRLVLQRVLCSEAAERCLAYDHAKLQQALRTILLQHLRAIRKLQRRDQTVSVNWVVIEAALHSALSWQRIPARSAVAKHKQHVLHTAAQHIARIVSFMAQHCEPAPPCLKQPDFLIGLLYQMRVGVIVHDFVVLPRLPLLAYLLPAEQHLAAGFHVRAKAISEAENVVKHNLRKLSATLLATMQGTL